MGILGFGKPRVFSKAVKAEKMKTRWHELGRALCRRMEEHRQTGGDRPLALCLWRLLQIPADAGYWRLPWSICCRKSTGNCSRHILAGLFFDTVKEVVMEVAFTQDRFMLRADRTSATRLQNLRRENGKVTSKTVAFSKKYIHPLFCLWKEKMWSALLAFDKPVTWLAWGRVKLCASVPTDSIAGCLLCSQLTLPGWSCLSLIMLSQGCLMRQAPLCLWCSLGQWTELKWSGALLWPQANENWEQQNSTKTRGVIMLREKTRALGCSRCCIWEGTVTLTAVCASIKSPLRSENTLCQ